MSSSVCREITGVILAGGKSSRYGENKALLPIGEGTVVSGVRDVLAGIFPRIILSANNPGDYNFLNLKCYTDFFADKGPLGGIHSALVNSETEKIFITTCDMPLIRREDIIEVAANSEGSDITVVSVSSRIQPLFGVYSKKLIPEIERILTDDDRRNYSVKRLLDISDTKILEADGPGIQFTNINKKEDYQFIKSILK